MESNLSSLNKVTALSKIIAAVLFVCLPFIGFGIGYNYGVLVTESQMSVVPIEDEEDITLADATSSPTPSPVSTLSEYVDPVLGFSLNYDESWSLKAVDGTFMNDGSGRTVTLTKQGYVFNLRAQYKPEIVGDCAGLFEDDAYVKNEVDEVQLWRLDYATSLDGESPWIEIVSPMDNDSYTCSLEIEDKIFSISYHFTQLQPDPNNSRVYDIDQVLLAELDGILNSINW